jgi:tricorn protease
MRRLLCTVLVAAVLPSICSAQTPAVTPADFEETRLLRFPATNGSTIAFSYAGQLYTVDVAGGIARRLTDGPGYAIFPRFSANGEHLAFTAQYDGNTEVYVMPAAGGPPARLTYSATLDRDDLADRMGPNNIVMAWRNTAPEIVFRSRWRSFNPFIGELFTVGLEAEVPQQLPVPRGGFITFSPDDRKIAYNRIFREFRTWKQYRGGMADDVWVYDLTTGELENITNHPAQDIFPMWASNGRIYFVSERTSRANLFVYDPATRETRQLTQFQDYDVKFPSLGPDAIVFEHAGAIWRVDLATEQVQSIPIGIREDLAAIRPTLLKADPFVQSVKPSPDGQRVAVVARGDVFSVPARHGATRNLTRSSGSHDRDARWSPDGRWIVYFSDETGEFELYVRPQDGSAPAEQITSGSGSYAFAPVWAPDSRHLMWSDREQRLHIVDMDTKRMTTIAHNPDGVIQQYSWSPDSKWIAWTRLRNASVPQIMLFSVDRNETFAATDGWFDANTPIFSDDGKWLVFASARDFRPIYSDTEWNHAYQDMERVYLQALSADSRSPLAPRSDEVKITEPGAAQNGDKKEKNGETSSEDGSRVVVRVDVDGLAQRVVGLPIPPSNYSNLRMIGSKVFYRRTPGAPVGGGGGGEGFGAGRDSRTVVAFYDLEERRETELGSFDDFEISANGKRMLVRQGREWSLIDLPSAKVELKPENRINFGHLQLTLDRQAEWAQIFDESWRQMRDFFYAPSLHGVNWRAQHTKYRRLLPYVAHRNDLTYLIGEMIAELRIGHAYVGGGDRAEAPRVKTGLLGAEFSRDSATGAYRVDRVLRGEHWLTRTRSPLVELGVNVNEGDYILAVDGVAVTELPNLYAALIGTVGQQVRLRVNTTPSEEGARDIVVVPIGDEAPLYYEAFVQANIDYVSEKTGGRVGYLHIPDMGPQGLNEFVRRFYPQLNREALIIDVRGNGGGNVSPQIIERLRRELVMINYRRNGTPTTNPSELLLGPKVTLLNEYSASDGDLFPYRFRQHGLGRLIGKRSWGGVVGISGTLPFSDGGFLNKPEFAPYASDGSGWIIEGQGVEPDIIIDNEPMREFRGEDQQLDKAIEVILEELQTRGQRLPPPPAWPVR